MEALLPVFIAILLAETGGRVQARSHDLHRRFGSAGTVLAVLGLTTVASLSIAAIGGVIVAGMVGFEARSLMAGLSLLFAGAPMFLPVRGLRESLGTGVLAASLRGFAPLQFGDASQFIVFAMAARTGLGSFAVGAGLTATLAAAALPIMIGSAWPGALPLPVLRRIAAALLVVAGCWMIVAALRLV